MLYAKFINYLLIAVVSPAALALSDGELTGQEVVNVAILALGAAAVYFKENTVTQPAAKAAVAVFTAVVTAVVAAWGDYHFSADEIATIVLAGLGAVQVWLVANSASRSGSVPRASL